MSIEHGAFATLTNLSIMNFPKFIEDLATLLTDKDVMLYTRIAAANEIKRNLSSSSPFFHKLQKDKWTDVNSNEIVSKVSKSMVYFMLNLSC